MKKHIKIFILAGVLASLLLLLPILTSVAQVRSLNLPWSVIGSGGMTGSAGGYTLHSTLGQPITGAQQEGAYRLTSGFIAGIQTVLDKFFNYLPLIIH